MSIDTPDYQRGVVSAQKLLATVAGTDSTVTVGVPPNAETLIVTAPGFAQFGSMTCKGATTGAFYAGQQAATNSTDNGSATYFFDVSNALDAQVTLNAGAPVGSTWYVYSDAAAHLVADVSGRQTKWGEKYVVSVAPSVTAGDHPQVELQTATDIFASNGTVIDAPSAGQRLRLFHVTAGIYAGAGYCSVFPGVGGGNLLFVGAGAPVSASYLPSGVALPAATALQSAQAQPNTQWYVNVVYTVETV